MHLTAQSTGTYGRRAMLSSCLGPGRPTRFWRLSVCGTHLPGERKPSYSQLPLRLREIPRLTLPTSSRIAGQLLAFPLRFFSKNEVVNINARSDVSFSHRILCAVGLNTAVDVMRQEAGWAASCRPN